MKASSGSGEWPRRMGWVVIRFPCVGVRIIEAAGRARKAGDF
jgi:hypothetical protein